MKKILIMYASYGMGHKKIAEYVENYFKENGNFIIETIDILQSSTPFLGDLSKKTFEKINFSIPFIYDFLYNAFNRKLSLFPKNTIILSWFRNKKLTNKIIEYNPDLVISTHSFCSTIISHFKKKNKINSKLITIVTDYEAHEFWLENEKQEDYLIIGNSIEKKELVKKGFPKDKIKDIGIPLSKEFEPSIYNKEKTFKTYELDAKLRTLVFFCSRGTITSSYVKELVKNKLDYNIIIVTGNNSKLKNKITKIKNEYKICNAKILGYVNNVPELLNIADLVVTKPGGATVTECLYFNVPMLFIGKHSGQEKANCKYLEKQKCAIKVQNKKKLLKEIDGLINNEKRLLKFKNNISKISKNDAMNKLYSLALELMEE